jgi:hypothetical protein
MRSPGVLFFCAVVLEYIVRFWRKLIWRILAFAPLLRVIAFVSSGYAQTVINVPPSPSPTSAGADTIVNLLPSGFLAHTFQTLNGGVLNIQGGTANYAIAENGAQISMTSGEARALSGYPGSQISVHGGLITEQVGAQGIVNISGGRIFQLADFGNTANITVSGGAIEQIDIRQSPLVLQGMGFKLDGVPITGLESVGDSKPITIPVGSVLTGLLADGRAFGHHRQRGFTEPFALTLVRSAALPPPTPSEIHVSNTSSLEWVGEGQTLFVEPSGSIGQHFRAGTNSQIEVNGGAIREALHVVSAAIELNSGDILHRAKFFDSSVLNVRGGRLHSSARFFSGAVLNLHSGEVGGAGIDRGATANVYGGTAFLLFAEDGGW